MLPGQIKYIYVCFSQAAADLSSAAGELYLVLSELVRQIFFKSQKDLCVYKGKLSSLRRSAGNQLPEEAAERENITRRQIRSAAFSSRQFSSRSKFDGNEIQTLSGSQMFHLNSPKLETYQSDQHGGFPPH